MDRFKLNRFSYVSYEITPNTFDKYTNRTYPFVQKDAKHKNRFYGVCPGCNNPIVMVSLYQTQNATTHPYGRHVKHNISEIAKYSHVGYDNCPYANKNNKSNNKFLPAKSAIGISNKRLLKEQYDQVIYILRKQTDVLFSNNLAQKMLDEYVNNTGWLYRNTTSDNLPWKFGEVISAKSLGGQYVKTDSDIQQAIRQYYLSKGKDIECEEKRMQVPLGNFDVCLKFVFEDFRSKLNGEHLQESITFVVFDSMLNNEIVYQKELPVEPDFLINLMRNSSNQQYRNKVLMNYAQSHVK